ncbi:MAG: diadenylate cyclase CdaA [Chloroflexi bacterium]|nr:TIGR00159 family protein [Candidatus Atribacteria bacterium]MCX6037151.1 diadenylate cyclase CdaA [Chloroflexota bacterium]
MTNLLINILFIFQRLDWLGVIDILLVTLIFFGVLYLVRDTQAMILLRGIILILVLVALLTSLANLPAFSWLVRTALPALVFAIPVIFAPEIRRALERIGRAGTFFRASNKNASEEMQQTIQAVVAASARLSARQHGALIILERFDRLDEYVRSGVILHSDVTPEMLMQTFYPNTPLHDGAVIISGKKIVAAACVMPLSASGILARSPERQMGLRHRAALGISEVTDAIAVVVSEQTGAISIAHAGRIIRRLDVERLENILIAFYNPEKSRKENFFQRHFPYLFPRKDE